MEAIREHLPEICKEKLLDMKVQKSDRARLQFSACILENKTQLRPESFFSWKEWERPDSLLMFLFVPGFYALEMVYQKGCIKNLKKEKWASFENSRSIHEGGLGSGSNFSPLKRISAVRNMFFNWTDRL